MPPVAPSPPRRIAVVTDYIGSYGRGVLRGAIRYAQEGGHWDLVTFPMFLFSVGDAPQWRDWAVDGFILQVTLPSMLRDAQTRRIPTVNVSEVLDPGALPSVLMDNVDVGRLAAEHLLERGLRHFAFSGPPTLYATRRLEGFAERLARAGHDCIANAPIAGKLSRADPDFHRLCDWVAALPRPVGLFAATDIHAVDLVEACRVTGVAVPEQAAVLGVDDDELVTRAVRPALSSVVPPAERIGYEAATLLDQILQNTAPPTLRPRRIPSTSITTRQSTNVLAIDDPDVAQAVRFIRTNAHRPIGVADVLEAVPTSRRSLERRFRKALGRSPLDEITRLRIERAKQLLAETDLQIRDIARASGFADATYLGVVFRRTTGQSPSHYRQSLRGR